MGVEEVKSKDEAGEKEEGAENEPEVLEITPEEEEEWMNSFEIYFNPDVFNPNVEQNLSEEQRVADEAQVRELSAYLHERIIPEFCQEFANAGAGIASSILDEEQLRETMHRRGINMRFLGTIAKIVRDLPANDTTRYLEDLLQHEMVIRAFKRVFGRVVGSTSSLLSVQASAHLLNCLLARGDARPAVPSGPEVPLSPAAKNTQNFAKYTRANLWSEIRAEVKARFRHDLPEDFAVTRVLPVIRSVCQRLGLQIASRKYDWTAANAQIFGSDDIVNIYPVNKVPWVRSSVGDDLLETARMALSQGQYKYGVELLQESVTAYDQTFGMVHPDVVRPLAMLAMIQSQANDKAEQDNSLQNQFKVVTILERTRGLDSHETVTGYLQLGIRTVETGDPVAGLNYLRHALELMEMLTCSRPHPELYSLYVSFHRARVSSAGWLTLPND